MKLTPITDEWREAYFSGRQDRAYAALGSRLTKKGAVFRVWAPDALLVSVVGDFNAWTPGTNVMRRLPDGFWETEIEGLRAGDTYKYAISARDGQTLWKADPYAFWAEKRPGTASRLYEPDGYRWTDADWMERRRANKVYHAPLNVYEVHAGSWRRPDGETPSYGWLKKHLIPYVKRRRDVLESSLRGLLSAERPDHTLIARVREDIDTYDDFIEKGIKPYDSQGTV